MRGVCTRMPLARGPGCLLPCTSDRGTLLARGSLPAAPAQGSKRERLKSMNLVQQIFERAERRGLTNAPALICEDRSLSYGELIASCNRYGNAFRRAGVERGDRVLFLMDDTPELVAAWLGTLVIGAVSVALNLRMTPAELLFIVRESRCRCLLIHHEFLPLYLQIKAQLARPPQVVLVDGEAEGGKVLEIFLDGCSTVLEPTQTCANDIAYWIYSSGTTGRPKAAVHLHRDIGIARRYLCENLGVQPADRIFTVSKLFFGFALAHSLLAGLSAGAGVILYRGWPEARALASFIAKTRPDVVFGVPTIYRNFIREGTAGSDAFKRIRHFVSSGEKLPAALFNAWRERTGQPIIEGVGASETTFLFISNTPTAYCAGSCGKPLPWADIRLTDEDGNIIVRPDTPGTLWVRMASVCVGYWLRPELSEHVFHDDWFRTGDAFSFDADGWWYHHGRSDDMLKVSGQWVSPMEIEFRAIAVPGIAEAAVVAVPNEDGLMRLTLFLVAGRDHDPRALGVAVQSDLRRTLSTYKCPRDIRFIAELPRTATGKTQRFRLREMLRLESASVPGAPPAALAPAACFET